MLKLYGTCTVGKVADAMVRERTVNNQTAVAAKALASHADWMEFRVRAKARLGALIASGGKRD